MITRSVMYKGFATFGLVCLLAACGDEGPMEQAGEQLDEAATDTQNAIEDKCEAIKGELKAEDTDC